MAHVSRENLLMKCDVSMKKVAIPISIFIILSGCVRSNVDFIDDRTISISAGGTAFDNSSGVMHHVFLKSAQIALSHGFRYFQIVSDSRRTNVDYWVQPGQTQTTGQVSYFGNTANYTQTTNTTPGTVTEFRKPHEDSIVRFYKEGEVNPNQYGIWDAQRIIDANQSSGK